MKISEGEWYVLEVLWKGESFALKNIAEALKEITGWSKNTVYTYLNRMEAKGLVKIEKGSRTPYSAAVSREKCAKAERDELLTKVYSGATSDLISAFLKETPISKKEVERLRKLLDEMEV
ncbi:MAG: BlaI/MecI/CopY family transcriptional regulator [Clostridia bacterium]|nr:BlaI/MecI/CopY family transcriptional regulator [Clostridia bacterium]MBQ8029868.1 BlaI/MecI/CopY family transcriptional regulator [Clostridia bacterium]